MQKLKQKLTENGLFQAAKRYKNDGFSIIPVNAGSSDNAKLPTFAWKPFQKRQPTDHEITQWFSDSNPDIGIAIVCGSVSQLIVLDLDNDANATFRDFNHGMADLLQTYIVRTPGREGLHIYWRVNFPVASQKVRGGDLQAEGKYVVAPPTIINGQPYQPINDLPIKTLQPQELQQILDFLSVLPQPDCSLPQPNNKTRSMTTNEQSLSDFYYHISHKAGRNNGLFAAARKARNQHWSLAETIIYLTPLHTAQIGNLAHRKENIHQRHREALRTIASAFSRPALEPLPDSSVQENPGLPNAVREALLQTQIANTQQSCAAARVLDALRMVGWKAGKIFTASEALTVCKVFKIGRDSLLRALSAVGKWGRKLIPKSLMLSRVSAPDKSRIEAEPPQLTAGGRPKQRYEMPDNAYLQAAVGISETAPQESDPLQPDDLASPSAYRAAVERELLKRRPGQYPNRWLARRLGISKRTIQRYHKLLGISIKPVFGYTQYTDSFAFRDLKSRNAEPCGIWLQDQDGKRYPPIAALAAKLQKRGHILTFIRQQPNYYSLSSPSPQAGRDLGRGSYVGATHVSPVLPAQNEHKSIAQMFWRCLRCGAFIPGQSKHTPSHCEACALGAPALKTGASHIDKRELLSRLRSGIGGQQTFPPKVVSAVLTWRNLHDIVPPQEYAPETGAWLQDPSGKRYPPIRGLAMRLLKRFGTGNVRYFSYDESAAVFHDLGVWLAREGQYEGAMHFFRRAGLNAVDADTGQ